MATVSCAARVSLAAERRNFRRAGVLKKRPRMTTVVPRCRAAAATRSSRPAYDAEVGSLTLAVAGSEGQAGDRCDGGKGFTAESEGGDSHQIGGAADLARGVPVQGQDGILTTHPGSVIAHRNQDLAAVLQLDPHMASTRIECILDQLLHHRGGTLHHLARGDLVGDGIREDCNTASHRRNLSADGGDGVRSHPPFSGTRGLHQGPARPGTENSHRAA